VLNNFAAFYFCLGTWVRDAVDAEGMGILTLADGTEHKFGSFTDELISFD
jgi:hypothetical protein